MATSPLVASLRDALGGAPWSPLAPRDDDDDDDDDDIMETGGADVPESLSFRSCSLTRAQLDKCVAGLRGGRLRSLELWGVAFDAADARRLGSALRGGNSSLHTLELGGNPELTDEALVALAQGLPQARALRSLGLESCGLRDGCGAALASVLEGCASLGTVRLQHNKLGDRTMTAVAQALSKPGSAGARLERLHLQHNSIGDRGASALREFAEGAAAASLELIDLRFNLVTRSSTLNAIEAACRRTGSGGGKAAAANGKAAAANSRATTAPPLHGLSSDSDDSDEAPAPRRGGGRSAGRSPPRRGVGVGDLRDALGGFAPYPKGRQVYSGDSDDDGRGGGGGGGGGGAARGAARGERPLTDHERGRLSSLVAQSAAAAVAERSPPRRLVRSPGNAAARTATTRAASGGGALAPRTAFAGRAPARVSFGTDGADDASRDPLDSPALSPSRLREAQRRHEQTARRLAERRLAEGSVGVGGSGGTAVYS